MRILVTGGCGFIGCNLIRHLLQSSVCLPSRCEIWNLDALTYAGNPDNLTWANDCALYHFLKGSVSSHSDVRDAFKIADPELVIHLAAESHVDRSIQDAAPFIETNVTGTQNLLDVALKMKRPLHRFIHISTDEVYGALGYHDKPFHESSPIQPNSPYAASKAAAELLAWSYYKTHELPVVILRPSNNYGPHQGVEKLVPRFVTNLLLGQPLNLYGNGRNMREWLFVDDTCVAIERSLVFAPVGGIFNIGGVDERTNVEVTFELLRLMDKPTSAVEFVKDRKGHDLRYAIDSAKAHAMLNWEPRVSFHDGMARTVKWYIDNQSWWKKTREQMQLTPPKT